jgi:hypothetical protein
VVDGGEEGNPKEAEGDGNGEENKEPKGEITSSQ